MKSNRKVDGNKEYPVVSTRLLPKEIKKLDRVAKRRNLSRFAFIARTLRGVIAKAA